nr:hypothetical protein CFP56_04122 [Quercus suber]
MGQNIHRSTGGERHDAQILFYAPSSLFRDMIAFRFDLGRKIKNRQIWDGQLHRWYHNGKQHVKIEHGCNEEACTAANS